MHIKPNQKSANSTFDNVVASGGGNIVNVIIVDLEGFDTLFEITVMTMVALIIYAMFRIFKKRRSKR